MQLANYLLVQKPNLSQELIADSTKESEDIASFLKRYMDLEHSARYTTYLYSADLTSLFE